MVSGNSSPMGLQLPGGERAALCAERIPFGATLAVRFPTGIPPFSRRRESTGHPPPWQITVAFGTPSDGVLEPNSLYFPWGRNPRPNCPGSAPLAHRCLCFSSSCRPSPPPFLLFGSPGLASPLPPWPVRTSSTSSLVIYPCFPKGDMGEQHLVDCLHGETKCPQNPPLCPWVTYPLLPNHVSASPALRPQI